MNTNGNGPFKGKVAIVTGAGYGIGRAIALALAAEGGRVVLAARSKDKIESVAAEIDEAGGEAETVPTDVRDEVAVKKMVQRTSELFGRLDILINNAGIAGPTKLATEVLADEWHETIETNLTGAFFCSKHAVRRMLEEGGGTIVNIASVAGRIGYPFRSPYAASKWGMIGLNHSLAEEFGEENIRVNCVCPGPVQGERIDRVLEARAESTGTPVEQIREQMLRDVPMKRLVTPDEVTRAVLFFAGDDSSGMTGQVLTVCGGMRMQ